MGLRVEGEVSFDLIQMVARKNRVVNGLVGGIATLFKTQQITHIEGTGILENEQTVRVQQFDGSETKIQGDAMIIATGSSWPNLPQFPIDGQTFITSKEALDLTTNPVRIVIIGGGVEGCEFATYFSGLGTKVSVIEMMPRILPQEDEEIGGLMLRELKKRKVVVHLGTTVKEVRRIQALVSLMLTSGAQIETDMVLVSVGRGFNTQGIGLEKVGVQLGARGKIEVNDHLETNVPGVYAIGDVVGKAMLAHVASAQGKIAVENAMGQSSTINYDVIPAGIFTLPEIGRVGLTEQQVKEQGREAKVGRFRYAGLGKAQGVGETTGMFKVIADAETDALLGVHIIGAHAADLIHEAALAMELKAPASAMAGMIHAHPTLSEGMMEAAEDLEGLAIHQAPKRK